MLKRSVKRQPVDGRPHACLQIQTHIISHNIFWTSTKAVFAVDEMKRLLQPLWLVSCCLTQCKGWVLLGQSVPRNKALSQSIRNGLIPRFASPLSASSQPPNGEGSQTVTDTAKQTFSPGAAQNSDFDVVPLMEEDHEEVLMDDDECFVGTYDNTTDIPSCVPMTLVTLPTHSNVEVNVVLQNAQSTLRTLHMETLDPTPLPERIQHAKAKGRDHGYIYANNYVDLGKIDTYVDSLRVVILTNNIHSLQHWIRL